MAHHVQLGQHPDPTHTIAHVSDPHLLAGGARQYGVVDPEAGLRLALDRLTRLPHSPDALVFTGDLTDLAEPAAYERLRALVEPAAEAMDAQVVWVMGNHDERPAYSRLLFGEESDAPQDRTYDVRGLRVVVLDTTVPGYHHGELADEQLTWLAGVLAEPAPHGTLLALHHPPIPVPMLRAAQVIELADQHRLAEVVAGTDVRSILGGHFHFTTYSTFAGIPVSVASASCYTSDPAPLHRFVSGIDGHQAMTMVHVYDDRVVQTVVPLADAPEVSGVAATVVAQLEALSAEERRELLSRKDSPFNRGELADEFGRW
ncbi:metallophosphoesterase [Nocardioides marmotae]|uniref:Phosphodiesterase n=1 Tax=Nocardioides marmotae TaxID=2663857 RepID=A0A6I3J4C0_9ACTN|nr:metallophosphoesterase [Nocardioides marmotae]MCR6030153.1 phosphodiesterase [Gordonia jinghuaiqii]MBC9733033.1 metallophosphoesterase [Nocardioides marmotae]MTB84147.1 phosphodiesterase [Nocardioides marmotae]MTB93784.1 phosphodiesterase [Nocardioides marmotae]QKE00120.1 phosphodiesterase [Nocardioides marmotae]